MKVEFFTIMTLIQTKLMLRDLRLNVHLGCGEDERRKPQPVSIDLALLFSTTPAGCQSDELTDTICYGKLSERLSTYCNGRSFKLVEALTSQLFEVAKQEIERQGKARCRSFTIESANVLLALRGTKLHPPVADLNGGVNFSIEEWTPSW